MFCTFAISGLDRPELPSEGHVSGQGLGPLGLMRKAHGHAVGVIPIGLVEGIQNRNIVLPVASDGEGTLRWGEIEVGLTYRRRWHGFEVLPRQ